MKFIFTLFLLVAGLHVFSQWSDTTNSFTDSMHMQVTTAPRNQQYSFIVRSYPDSGYFVIWQDTRNDPANSKFAIYAQKYSKAGVAQWTANGMPISASSNNQHYRYGSMDYRLRSYAATDSAGGFYIAYADDSVTNVVYQRACVQHMLSNGNTVFSGAGYIISSNGTGAGNNDISPQLIADGNGGFFYSFIGAAPTVGTPARVMLYCYKDAGGTLQSYGGGQMNENAIQITATSPCGNYTYLQYMDADVDDYNITSDLQGGCNVVMALNVNGQGVKLGYNKLFRAKKLCSAQEYSYDDNYNLVAGGQTYTAGNVYRLYYLRTDHQTISCGSSSNVYVVNQYRLIQNGFQEIDGGASLYNLVFPKIVTVSSTGNINATLLATQERTYAQNVTSNYFVKGYVVKEEIYDSIPYQRTSNTNPNYPGYITTEPATLNKLNNFRDTILTAAASDFTLGGGANQIFLACIETSGGYVNLQHLAVEAQTADSFALVYKTAGKTGSIIGKGSYEVPPMLAVNNAGNALFYIKDNVPIPYEGVSFTRVSPITTGATLNWGAMGKLIGTGIWSNSPFYNFDPFVSLDPVNGTALVSWTDERNNSTTGRDIYIRHLDDLNNTSYEPPYKRVKPASNPYGPKNASANLYGTTNNFTTIEISNTYSSDPGVSPVVDISDNYNLGTVTVSVSDNTSGIRTTNGKPYLDRSYTITPQNNPNGAATITLRLFFTTAQFNALKAADPTIRTPGDLAVIKQPGTGSGSTYTVVSGEQTVIPQTWAAVDGGYYIQIEVTSFSNFFILKNANALPVTWLGVQAQWQNKVQAKVSWQIAEEQNVKSYTVQRSENGLDYSNVCTVNAGGLSQYSCVVPAGSVNYYRVMETDMDGQSAYSKTVLLQNMAQGVSLYPNPAKDVLYINGIQKYAALQVVDMKGNVVQQQTVTPSNYTLDISKLSKGHYLLRLVSSSDVQTLKFIKQ
ncbi:MAG: T9SS type A sorting domain-containing protein [Chitinophagaceae bacterium]